MTPLFTLYKNEWLVPSCIFPAFLPRELNGLKEGELRNREKMSGGGRGGHFTSRFQSRHLTLLLLRIHSGSFNLVLYKILYIFESKSDEIKVIINDNLLEIKESICRPLLWKNIILSTFFSNIFSTLHGMYSEMELTLEVRRKVGGQGEGFIVGVWLISQWSAKIEDSKKRTKITFQITKRGYV